MAALSACENYVLIGGQNELSIYSLRGKDESQAVVVPNCGHRRLHNAKGKSETNTPDAADDTEQPSNHILASSFSHDGQFLGVCDDNKYLHIYKMVDNTWVLNNSKCVSRRCTSIDFTRDSKSVLVGDKSGDVYSFSTDESSTHSENNNKAGENLSKEEEPEGKLVLGHHSMLLDLILIDEDRFVVSADRDEKIRLSNFPDAFDISGYCLGHTAFVISLAWDIKNKRLFSGSGDGTVRIWNVSGDELSLTNCTQYLESSDFVTQNKENEGTALRNITLCQSCQLLFVSVNQCSSVLVFEIVQSSESTTLKFYSKIPGSGEVLKACISGSVLWTTRLSPDDSPSIHLTAYRYLKDSEHIQIAEINEKDTSIEAAILMSVKNRPRLLTAPPPELTTLSHLWKSHIDGYIEDYKTRKRQRLENEQSLSINSKRKLKNKAN